MGDVTPKGYPFPVGTDRVMDGDDAIEALAVTIDGKLPYAVWVGSVTVPVNNTQAASAIVTIPAGRFPVAPRLTSTVRNTSVWFSYTQSISATSVTVGVRTTGAAATANIPVDFYAVCMMHDGSDG